MDNNENFNQLLNRCQNPQAVGGALLELKKAGLPDKPREEGRGMEPIPEKYANRPNLWRLACELATYEEPDKMLDTLIRIFKSSVKEARP